MKTLIACVSSRNEFGLFHRALDLAKSPSHTYLFVHNNPNLTLVRRYQEIYESASRSGDALIVYMHDDVEIFDPDWLEKIHKVFLEQPKCAVVGFGGATSLGHPDLYKTQYRLQNLARGDYASSQRDWQIHGTKLTTPKRVAVLDAFLMAIKTDLLKRAGGWPVESLSHHCLDTWLACEAARQGKETWAIPVDCQHYGGGTSVTPEYYEACRERGTTPAREHEEPHLWVFDSCRDVLPLRVG